MTRGLRRSMWVVAAALVAGAMVWQLRSSSVERSAPAEVAEVATSARSDAIGASALPTPPSAKAAFPKPDVGAPNIDPPAANSAADSESANDEMAMAWATVDMDDVRRAMPDNLYWKLSVPTKDPAVEEERRAERDRWNVEYGKILSGTASEEEIRAYFDYRATLSTDYVEFVTHLLDHYEGSLPERDVGLLQLARKLNHARLEEIPRKVEEALERKRQQDEARAAWLADEADFGAAAADADAE